MNDMRTVNTDKLRLARIQYWDLERHAAEIPDINAYAILVEDESGNYYNLFDCSKILPVYERTNYVNTTKDGIQYGNLLKLVDGEETEGLCYVLEKINIGNVFSNNIIFIDEISDYVKKSSKFFIDRIELLKKEIKKYPRKKEYIKKLLVNDYKLLEEFNNYVNSHDENEKKYLKY